MKAEITNGVRKMPVNSFDDYPMAWRPKREDLSSPLFLCLADRLEQDIKNGILPPNTQLPPQRELADFLDLNLSTVTKAYRLCEVRGLVHAVIGKGTFVMPNANVPISIVEKNAHPEIEMGTIHPFYVHNGLIRDLTIELLKKPYSEQLFEYTYPLGTPSQINAGAKWLRRFGLEADETNTLIAAGVQNALATVLASMFEAGDKIAVDTYTYANFISLANLLHMQLVAVENDAEGMRADLLDSACTAQKIKGVYLMPTGENPTNLALSDARQAELAQVIQKRGLLAIEDDNYSAMLETRNSPLALLVPKNCIYISGLSKPVCAGLRIAYVRVPNHLASELERGAFSQNLKLSTLNMEIAANIIQSGLDLQIIREKRALAIHRNKIFREVFPDTPCRYESYCQWLILPKATTGRMCEAALARCGVGVFGAERFSVGTQAKHNAIRIATCSPENDDLLRKGLGIVRDYILAQEAAAPALIV